MIISERALRKIIREITAVSQCDIATSPPDKEIFMDIKDFVKSHGGCGISDETITQLAYGYALNRLLPVPAKSVSDEMGKIQNDLNAAIQRGLQGALSIKNT